MQFMQQVYFVLKFHAALSVLPPLPSSTMTFQ
jgi:hypothetical protein